ARYRGRDRRLDRDRAHRADHPDGWRRVPTGDLATGERRLGGSEERVTAHRDGRRPRVRGLADEPQNVALDTVGAYHHTSGSPHRLEHGALLDVQLEVRTRMTLIECPTRFGHPRHVDAILDQRVREPHAITVDQASHPLGFETATRT